MFSSSLGSCFRLKKPNPKFSKLTTEKVGSIDDLLIEIFLHLPLKPLFRFKSVSKHWNSIISDPKFQLMRNQAHSNNRSAAGLIFQNYNFKISSNVHVSLDRSPPPSNPRPQIRKIPQTLTILHSCNGLLILRGSAAPTYPEYDYYVCNPTTNKHTTIPLLQDEIGARRPDCVIGMYLVFEPSKSPHYRVVCVWSLDWKSQFNVYSSETGSWKRGRHVDVDYVNYFGGVYWNGAIHWVTHEGKCGYFNPDHHDDGMPRVMPTPPHLVGNTSGYFLGESFGHLHCALLVGDHYQGFRVYEMRSDYSEWFLRYRVDDFSQYLPKNCTVRRLFCVVRGERDEEDSLVLGTQEGKTLRYNIVRNTFQTIKVKPKLFWYFNTKLFPYIETLCFV